MTVARDAPLREVCHAATQVHMRDTNVHQYWVYMMSNRWNTVLYTGVSNSLQRRVWQHKNGAIPGFTKKYNCTKLVYYEEYDRIDQAIAREKQIKGWLRARKDVLVATMNPEWKDIAEDWYSELRPKAP